MPPGILPINAWKHPPRNVFLFTAAPIDHAEGLRRVSDAMDNSVVNTAIPPPSSPRPSVLQRSITLSSLEIQPDAGALRVVYLRHLLLGPLTEAGRRFQGAQASKVDCSFEAYTVDYFLSHAWATPWSSKYLALLYHFNANLAVMITAILALVAFFVQNLLPDVLPLSAWPLLVLRRSDVDGTTHEVPQLTYILATLAFPLLLLLLNGRFVHTPTCFLDSCCVEQHDRRRKAAGIASLGAIVARSERLLVLVDEHTFTRLWCIFELASFYRRSRGSSRMIFLPLHAAWGEAALFCSVGIALTGSFYASRPGAASSPLSTYDAAFPAMHISVLLNFLVAWQQRVSVRAVRALRHFTLDSAQCSSEADKQAILSLIGDWYADAHAGESEPERLRQLGHRSFESLVRYELTPLLERRANTMLGSGSFVRLLLVCWVPRLLDWCAAPSVSLLHALQLSVVYLWFGVSFFVMLTATAAVGVSLVAALSELLARRTFGGWLGERARFFLIAPVGLCCSMPLMLLPWEFLFLVLSPKNLDQSALGLQHVWPFRELQARYATYEAPGDGLDADLRALYKQQLVTFLALGVGALALTLVGGGGAGRGAGTD